MPVNLMHTAEEDPGSFVSESEALGVLRVELLETDGLKNMDFPGFENDVYAIVVFEDSTAATRPINDVNSPRFHNECARAFRFPILSPHSSVYIGIFDSDDNNVSNSVFSNLTHLVNNLETAVNSTLVAINR